MENRNEVYWLIHRERHGEYPQSDSWDNDLYIIYENLSFADNVEMILDTLRKNRPARYAVVTDAETESERELVRKTFISNNVIDISGGYDRLKVMKQIEWILSDFGRERDGASGVWLVSDTHFYHRNIIRYCSRPWNSGLDAAGDMIITDSDVLRMNDEIVSNWNAVVGENDTVWHLGDFCLGPDQKEHIPELVKRLNGKINLVVGNHDHHSVDFYYKAGFHRVYDRPVVINSYCILSHAPMEFVKSPFFNCFGHVHDCETYKTWSADSCCVCVERHNYTPVSMKLIERKWKELNSEKYDIIEPGDAICQ